MAKFKDYKNSTYTEDIDLKELEDYRNLTYTGDINLKEFEGQTIVEIIQALRKKTHDNLAVEWFVREDDVVMRTATGIETVVIKLSEIQGPKGDKGDTGERGPKGEKGDTGERGPKGDKGDTGPKGDIGPQGPQGPKGDKGEDGKNFTLIGTVDSYDDIQNVIGQPGEAYFVGTVVPRDVYTWDTLKSMWVNQGDLKGPKGEKGDKGDPGERGPKGEKGDKGDRGPEGPRGLRGPQGLKGDKGDTGEQGGIGPQGPRGIQGIQGPRGPKGDKGDTGPEGPQGPKGDKGDTGPEGPMGPQGLQGPKGKDGLTPYIAENGNWWIGETDTEIKAKGEKGDKGDPGERGPEGPQGPKGEKGDRGPEGPEGPQGPKGDATLRRVRVFNEQDELISTQILHEGESLKEEDKLKNGYLFEYGTRNEFNYNNIITEDIDLTYSIIPPRYVQATVEDFTESGTYIGPDEYIILPKDKPGGYQIFNPIIKGVATNGDYLTDAYLMFAGYTRSYLELDYLNTSNVTNMSSMFIDSAITTLDLSNFDTSNVTDMSYMFSGSKATELDLSSFDTSNVTDMTSMFYLSQATTLDLSSFDTSNVSQSDMHDMFHGSKATIGYARTQADADKFNYSAWTDKPSTLNFVVKEDTSEDSGGLEWITFTNIEEFDERVEIGVVYIISCNLNHSQAFRLRTRNTEGVSVEHHMVPGASIFQRIGESYGKFRFMINGEVLTLEGDVLTVESINSALKLYKIG